MSLLEKYEPYLIAVVNRQAKGIFASGLRRALAVLAKIYAAAIGLRVFLYRSRLLRPSSLGCTVISVGNITLGGTGKTPMVEMLARELNRGGRKVAILSRGYKSGRKVRDFPRVVADGKELCLDVIASGDEPYMLAREVPQAVVIVDKDRVRAAKHAVNKFAVDTIILDDGYQYLRLDRQVNIMLIDCTNPFGNQRLLPRGVLREPLRHLDRADLFFLTKTKGMNLKGLKARLKKINPRADIIESAHCPRYLNSIFSGTKRDLRFLTGRRISCLSGIASPQGFEQALTELGAVLTSCHRFPDHHLYTAEELAEIIKCAQIEKAEALVTTEKDAVRFPALSQSRSFPLRYTRGCQAWNGYKLPLYYLRVEIEILSGAKNLYDRIGRMCY